MVRKLSKVAVVLVCLVIFIFCNSRGEEVQAKAITRDEERVLVCVQMLEGCLEDDESGVEDNIENVSVVGGDMEELVGGELGEVDVEKEVSKMQEEQEKPEAQEEVEVYEEVYSQDTITSYSNTSEESQMLKLVNAERAASGREPLKYSATLYSAAKIRCVEITQVFSHTRPDGSSCFTVSAAAAGENLAYSNSYDTQVAYNQFYNSGSHRSNMLDEDFTTFACNRVVSDGLVYWVQIFGYN